ncbi:MAG: Mur ligase family protein [Oscillospiraceae bacterium]
MTMTHSPHIAVVTNLAPNHLDIHKSMEEYVGGQGEHFPSPAARGHRHLQPGQRHHPASRPCAPRAEHGISAARQSRRTACSCGVTDIVAAVDGQERVRS